MHLRRRADQGDRQPGQGRRLVRQRVGLLQPARRPGQATSASRSERDGASTHPGRPRRPARQAGPGPLGPQRAARRRRRSPTTAGSGPACRPSPSSPTPGARVVVCAHLGRPKGAAGPDSTRLAPVAARLAELLGRPVAFADRHGRRQRPGRGRRRSATATSRCWRTSASTRARRARTTRSAARSPTSSPALADVYVGDGFGAVHRKHASVYDVAAAAAARGRATWWSPRSRCCDRLTERPGPALRRRARRLEGLRQARRHRQPARQGRPAADRRRHGLHLPQGPGPRGRQEPARGGPARRRPRLPRAGRESKGVEIVLPGRLVVAATEFAADAEPRRRRAPTHPGRPARARHRPGDRRSCSRRRSPTPGRCSGTARWASSSWRRSPRAPARSPQALTEVPTALTVVGGGDSAAAVRKLGFDEDGVRPHLDRRRRQPRVPRGQGAARASTRTGDDGAADDRTHEHPHPADGGQLEDEPQPPRGASPWCRSSRTLADKKTTSTPSRWRCCRRSPTSAAVQTLVDGDKLPHQLRRPGRVAARRRRLHRRDLRVDAGQARLQLRDGRALRAPRAPPRGRRAGQRQGAEGARQRDDRPIVCVGEGLGGPPGGPPGRAHAGAARRRAGRRRAPSRSPASSSPTSRSGRSAPARSPRPRTRRRSAPRSAPGWPSCYSGDAGRRRCGCSTAAR